MPRKNGESVRVSNAPVRLLVRWRALPELPSHLDLIGWLAEKLPAKVLVLSDSAVPEIERYPSLRSVRIGEWPKFHPAARLLLGWRKAAQQFKPDLILALDEAYCLSTHQMVSWACSRQKPSLYLSCQNIDRPLPRPFDWVERRVLRRVTGAWFLNEEARNRAERRGFRGKGGVIPLPVRPSDYPLLNEDPEKDLGPHPPEIDRPLVVGYAGRLVPEKGIDTLIEAIGRTGDRLSIVGEGPEKERLEAFAAARRAKVAWWGRVSAERMPEVYSEMDLLVLPSLETTRWKEQFGRVLVEAMASGVPVIGARSGEIPRVVGEQGLLFDPGDVESLVGQIRHLKENPELRRRLREEGLSRVRERFTVERVGRQVLDLVSSCLSS